MIPLILTYNRTLPDIKRAVNKHQDILKINRDFEQIFAELPIIAFRRNKNLQDILGKKTIINNKKQPRQSINQNSYSKPCNSKLNHLCCTQVQATSTFRSTVTHKTFKIYKKLNCKSKFLIYLTECVLYNKQYTGKSETAFNLRLNKNLLQADQQFRLPGHNSNKHSKFTLIEQLNDTNIDKQLLKHRLKKREDFWIIKLKTLLPHGFNAELNFPIIPNISAFLVHLFLRKSEMQRGHSYDKCSSHKEKIQLVFFVLISVIFQILLQLKVYVSLEVVYQIIIPFSFESKF